VPALDHVKVAGEPERLRKAERLAGGIPVDTVTWNEIVAAGCEGGPRAWPS
jgi:LDH2 family malate/lactate/ureidoglycolate dehydrogenase